MLTPMAQAMQLMGRSSVLPTFMTLRSETSTTARFVLPCIALPVDPMTYLHMGGHTLRNTASPIVCKARSIAIGLCVCARVQGHPMKPHRMRMTNSLVWNYGLYDHLEERLYTVLEHMRSEHYILASACLRPVACPCLLCRFTNQES